MTTQQTDNEIPNNPNDGSSVDDTASVPTAESPSEPAEVAPAAARDDAAGAPVTVDALQERIRDLEDRLLRTRAEVQNVQRRADQERRDAVRYANAELMRRLIAVLDDMERALAAVDPQHHDSPVIAGVRLVYENLLKALREFGMMPVEALHRPFDPHVHEAMLRQPTTDHPAGTVIEELAKGYVLHERTLRPSKVIVAAAPQGE